MKYHPNLRWNGATREEKRDFNDKLMQIVDRDIDIPRIVDWRVMRNLGCEKDLENMLLVKGEFSDAVVNSCMWKKAVEIKELVYKEWCLEFFSSVKVKSMMSDNEILTGEIMQFRPGGKGYSATLWEFGRMLGIYSEEDLSDSRFRSLIMRGERVRKEFDGDKYWMELSGEDVKVFGKKRVWKIKNPLLQIIHKILVKSIFHRNYYEHYVLDDDLWILHAFDRKHPFSHLNVVWLIAQHLRNVAVILVGTRICSGHLVTRLARSLGLLNEESMGNLERKVNAGAVGIRSLEYLRSKETGRLRGLPKEEDDTTTTTEQQQQQQAQQ